MSPSKSKPKLTTKDVCLEYYESQIFRPTGIEEASAAGWLAEASIFIEAADAPFKGIDFIDFIREITAINIELFGFIWLNHKYKATTKKSIPDSLLLEEIMFTKQYLQTGKSDLLLTLWETMAYYNDVIMNTNALYALERGWGHLRDILPTMEEEARLNIVADWLIKNAEDMEAYLSKHCTDSECVGRLVTRFIAVGLLEKAEGIIFLAQKLSLTLAERLGCSLNQEGLFALQRVIVGLHDNTVEYLHAVDEYGSYDAAKESRVSVIKALKKAAKRIANEHG